MCVVKKDVTSVFNGSAVIAITRCVDRVDPSSGSSVDAMDGVIDVTKRSIEERMGGRVPLVKNGIVIAVAKRAPVRSV